MRRGVVGVFTLVLAFTVLPWWSLHATPMYVRDWIVITVRSAPTEASQSMGTAQTNDIVEVLEESQGWSRIQTKAGVEGWVASRFLSAQAPKNLYVRQIELKLKALQDENMRLKGIAPPPSVAGTQGIVVPLDASLTECPEIKASYDKLLVASKDCTQKAGLLEAENSRLKNSERLFFTFIGGVFIILGVLIGLFIQMAAARSKKQGYKF